jgi:NitT/TauT family transport system substrate-binding protein
MNGNRSVRFVAVVLALFLAVAAVTSAEQLRKVRLAIGFIPHIQFAPLYVGTEKGFYAEEGIDLEIQYGFGIDIFSLLSVGRIDVGLSDSDQLIISGENDLGLKAVLQYYQGYPVSIVAQRSEIDSIQDLVGMSIGTPEMYGTSYIGLRLFLDHFGLADRVDVQRIGYTQVSSLLGGQVDAAVCFYNNEPIQMDLMGVDLAQWNVRDFSDMVGASFISSDTVLKGKADLLEGFVRATRRAMAYTVEHQQEALELSIGYLSGFDEEQRPFVRRALSATSDLYVSPEGYGHVDETKYQESIAQLEALGLIENSYPASRIIHEP